MVSKLILNAGKALLNRVGIMTERQMLAATTKAGRYARDIMSSGGTLSDELAGSILKKSLHKGVKAPNFVTTSGEATADWVANSTIFTREKALQTWNTSGGFNYVNPLTGESMITLNPSSYSPNVVAHEFRHHLDNTVPVSKKVKNLFDKFMGKFEFYRKKQRDFYNAIQDKYMSLESSILGTMGTLDPTVAERLHCKSVKSELLRELGVTESELSTFLSAKVNNLFCDENSKSSIKLLKKLIFWMKTEQNAQKAGSKITKAMAHIKADESCYSDMSAMLHGEFIPVLKTELKKQRKNYWKSLLGFKVEKGQIQQEKLKRKNGISRLIDAWTDPEEGKKVVVQWNN